MTPGSEKVLAALTARTVGALLLSAPIYAAGCASYTEETRAIRADFMTGDYTGALKGIDESSLKNSSSSKLLYHLERSMILDRMGEPDKSRGELIKADKVADDLYTTSVSKTTASFVVSDDVADYSGEDYERVAIQTMLALSFIGDGDLANAQVAARRINTKLAEINGTYTKEKKNAYSEDAFARYLAGMIHEARGDVDNAIVEYGRALALYDSGFGAFSDGSRPQGLIEGYFRLLQSRRRADRIGPLKKSHPAEIASAERNIAAAGVNPGQIAVIHEIGQISPKTHVDSVIGAGNQVVRMSFPAILYRPRGYGATGLEVGQKWYPASVGADMDAIGAQCLDDKKARIVAKGITRAVVKGALIEETRRKFGDGAALLANIVTAATETADTRGWTLLPGRFMVSRAWLPPGKHVITVKSSGREFPTEIELRPGELKLIRATDARKTQTQAELRASPTPGTRTGS
ncbi:hypothetical protein EBZ80_15555 [bacterium]|nr:hypothetical protein [bacterium]